MKKALIILAAIVLSLSFMPKAEAVLVEGYATADNYLWVWDYDGSGNWNTNSWYHLDSDNSWRTSEYFYGDAPAGETVDLYFAVKNLGTGSTSNPAGFLAGLSSAGIFEETGTNSLLSNTTWDIKTVSSWSGAPTVNPTTLTNWSAPTWYTYNSGAINPVYPVAEGSSVNGKSIWYDSNQPVAGPISNIDGNAQWIWTGSNFSSSMDNYAILHTQFTVIPEPATLSFLGMGLLSLLGFRKKV